MRFLRDEGRVEGWCCFFFFCLERKGGGLGFLLGREVLLGQEE